MCMSTEIDIPIRTKVQCALELRFKCLAQNMLESNAEWPMSLPKCCVTLEPTQCWLEPRRNTATMKLCRQAGTASLIMVV